MTASLDLWAFGFTEIPAKMIDVMSFEDTTKVNGDVHAYALRLVVVHIDKYAAPGPGHSRLLTGREVGPRTGIRWTRVGA